MASSVIEFEGTSTRLDVAAWSIGAAMGTDRVANELLAADPKTATDATNCLRAVTGSLSDDERARVAQRLETAERARAERALWDVQTESIINAAGVGMLDALILTTAEHGDWAVDLIDRSLDHVDASRLVIEHALSNRYDHYFGLFHPSLMEHATTAVDHVAGHAIDAGLNAGLDGAGHALSAIADAHAPVVTILRSVHRAARSSQAGLGAGRVGENLALDVGFKGGGIVAGMATGAMIGGVVPVAGHLIGGIIGGVLGGLLGGGAAESAKERHLHAAMEHADDLNEALGQSIDRAQWAKVAETMAQHQQDVASAARAVEGLAKASRRGVVPPLAHFILAGAAQVGSTESGKVTQEYLDWRAELAESSGPDAAAFRGIFALTRPDLHERLDLDTDLAGKALSAHHQIDEERQKLVLARG